MKKFKKTKKGTDENKKCEEEESIKSYESNEKEPA